MEKRDAVALLKVIDQAINRQETLFDGTDQRFVPDTDEAETIKAAKRLSDAEQRLDYSTGVKLMAIYRKAFK